MNELICYCFGYTAEDIRKDIKKNGRSLLMEKIITRKKTEGCNCAGKNPQKS